MKHTYEERLIAGLIAFGWRETERKSKYRTFTHPQQTSTLFVGASGALRAGRCATESHSIGCPSMCQTSFYKEVLAKGEEVLGATSSAKRASDVELYKQLAS